MSGCTGIGVAGSTRAVRTASRAILELHGSCYVICKSIARGAN